MRRSPLAALALSSCCLSAVGEQNPRGDAGNPTVADVFGALSQACARCGVAPYLCAHGVAHSQAFFEKAVDAGHILFSEPVAAACLGDLGSVSCAALDTSKAPAFLPASLPESCLALFEGSGTVQAGGSCWADALGFHGAVPDLGVGYAYLNECASGAVCSSFVSDQCPGSCVVGVIAIGCAGSCDAGSCDGDQACPVGSFCGAAGSCALQVGAGASCGGSEFLGSDVLPAAPECAWGLTCSGILPGAAGNCAPPTGEDGGCLGVGVFSDPGCELGLVCNGGFCTRLPSSGSAVSLLGVGCDPTTSFENLSGQCVPLLADGASCPSPDACQSGWCREGTCADHLCPEP